MGLGSDRAIKERQKNEARYEAFLSSNLDQSRVEHKATWENKCDSLHRANAVKRKVADIMRARSESLMERRKKLGSLLAFEQKQYERETVEKEETGSTRLQKTMHRALELKKKREDERQRVVQEKMYQQWREGVDELRQMDSKLFCMEVLAMRDDQVHNKLLQKDADVVEDEHWNKLWNDGYLAKLEREHREDELMSKRNKEMSEVLKFQVNMKEEARQMELEKVRADDEEMKLLWANQKIEADDEQTRNSVLAQLERKKVDEFAAIQKSIRENAEAQEREIDKNFVLRSMASCKEASKAEAEAKQARKEESLAFTEQLRREMVARASSDEAEETKFIEENRKQWDKRQGQWDAEADARQRLLEETYKGRKNQVLLNEETRDMMKAEIQRDRERIDAENFRLEKLEGEKANAETLITKRHQEELFRQMDFHQVQRMREMQQFKIEQRDGAIQEQKFRRAIKQEKQKLDQISTEIIDTRRKRAGERENATQFQRTVAPWEK